jgi:hypothetical protein
MIMSKQAIRVGSTGVLLAAVLAGIFLAAVPAAPASAAPVGKPRRLVVNLSGKALFDKSTQEGLMLAVPWKDLVYQFFPKDNVSVSITFMGAELESDARQRLFDVERARFLLARSPFGPRPYRNPSLQLMCEQSVCHIADWLGQFLDKVGFAPSRPQPSENPPYRPDEPAVLWMARDR